MGFLEWLQGPPKPIAPSSASYYLYAVKHHLVCHGLDMSSLVSSTVLSKQKKGHVNTFIMEDEHNLESNRRTLPLSVDILMGEVPDLHSKSTLHDRAFYTALMLGFTMLTRASNFMPIASATQQHISPLRWLLHLALRLIDDDVLRNRIEEILQACIVAEVKRTYDLPTTKSV